MATPKKPGSLPATSRAAIEFEGDEMARALQTDLPGPFPYLSRRLLAQPELLSRPEWRRIALRIVGAHAAEHPIPRLSSADIAFLVQMEELFGRSPEQARTNVAKDVGKSRKAIVHAHTRKRLPKRGRDG